MRLEGERHTDKSRRRETHRWEDWMKKTDRWKYKVHKTGGIIKSKIQWKWNKIQNFLDIHGLMQQ